MYHPNNLIERYKIKLVVQRFSQVYGIDYIKIFTPIVRRKSLRIFLAIATMLELILIQINIVGAYLESALDQNKHPIFMKIPQRCLVGRESPVCKIIKSLYSEKQAGQL